MKKLGDFLIRWIVESDLIAMLSKLVTSTTAIRHIIMWVAGALVAHGVMDQQYAGSEVIIGVAATLLTGSMTMFIKYVRDKYAAQAQIAAGAKVVDGFVGPKTVEAIATAEPPKL